MSFLVAGALFWKGKEETPWSRAGMKLPLELICRTMRLGVESSPGILRLISDKGALVEDWLADVLWLNRDKRNGAPEISRGEGCVACAR